MRMIVFGTVISVALALVTMPASAATSTVIDGHFKETYPKAGPPDCFTGSPCGRGNLKPDGDAAETFNFGGVDGHVTNGCALIHGTETITLADAESSSFQTLERDTTCNPGSSHQAPGHFGSYGNPESFTGTWTFVVGSGTGEFAGTCGGSGTDGGHFAGSAGIIDYTGMLTGC